jgi:16S rRNA processing protein RimM
VYVEGEATPRRIVATEPGGRVPALTLAGLTTREEAEAMAGRYLETLARPLPEGTYYWHELEGLRVASDDGEDVGVLREVFRAGEAEVYRIERTDGGELLVPAIHDVVRRIDVPAGIMVIHYEAEEVR